MKKGLLALLSLSLIVALPACKKDEGTAKSGKKEMKKKDGAKKEKHSKDKMHNKGKKADKKTKETMPATRKAAY